MSERGYERQKQVLVCGCDEQIASRVSAVLSDCSIERASCDDDVLEAIRRRPVDLILTAREKSAKLAVELLRRVNQTNIGPKPRVIILTTESSREDVIGAMRLHAFSYFSKPYFEAVFDEILRHAAGGGDWEDSIQVNSATPAWLRTTARCEVAVADRLTQFMNEVSDLSGKERESMGFALKEIVMNAMEYGGKFNRERLVEVSYVRGKHMILYRVRDPGDGFSLEELTHAAIANPPEEPVRHLEIRESMGIRPGGFGVLLTRKLVDDLIYSEQGNDVLLIKYLSLEKVISAERAQ
jgi:DNA-binding NarL/FixJ family response regulator